MLPRRITSALTAQVKKVNHAPFPQMSTVVPPYLNGQYPTLDYKSGLFSAELYKRVFEHPTPMKNHFIGFGQKEGFNINQFAVQVRAFALGLFSTFRAKKGQVLGLWMRNELEHAVLKLSASLIGLKCVSIHPEIPWEEAKAILRKEKVNFLCTSARLQGKDIQAFFEEIYYHEFAYVTTRSFSYPIFIKELPDLRHFASTSTDVNMRHTMALRMIPVYAPTDHDIKSLQYYANPDDVILSSYDPGQTEPISYNHKETTALADHFIEKMKLNETCTLLSTLDLSNTNAYVASVVAPGFASSVTVIPDKVFKADTVLLSTAKSFVNKLLIKEEHIPALEQALKEDAALPRIKRRFDYIKLDDVYVFNETGTSNVATVLGFPVTVVNINNPFNYQKLK